MSDEPLPFQLEALGHAFLARYRPGAILGRGTSGCVFAAHQLDLDRPVVVKVLDLGAKADPTTRSRFKKEAEILARLSHPRVLRILDYGVGDRFAWLTCPADGGEPMDRWLERRGTPIGSAPVEPGLALCLLRELLEGLAHVHARGVVHRDLKPANLLILPDGGLRIIDFGLARDLSAATALTATGTILGTPRYMAPDQIRGVQPSAADDLYSAGVIAYELLTGTSPFRAGDLAEVLARHFSYVPPAAASLRPRIPEEASKLVASLLSKLREERPASADQALACLSGADVSPLGRPARPSPASDPARATLELPGSEVPRRPRRLPLLAAFAGALAALLAGLFHVRPQPPEPRSPALPPRVPSRPEPPGAEEARLIRAELATAQAAQEPLGPDDRWLPPADPAGWPAALSRLPRTRGLLRWVAAGGDPASLEPAAAEVLAGSAAELDRVGSLLPFQPWLRAAPLAAGLPPEGEPEARLAETGPLTGWTGTMVGAARRARRIAAAREETSLGLGRGTPCPPEFSPEVWKMAQLWILVESTRASDLSWLAHRLYPQAPPIRPTLVAWMAPGPQLLAEMVHAASRAVAENPRSARGTALALYAAGQLSVLGPFGFGPAAFLDTRVVVRGGTGTPQAALVELAWTLRVADARIKAETGLDMDPGTVDSLALATLAASGTGGSERDRIVAGFAHTLAWIDRGERYALLGPALEAARAGILGTGPAPGPGPDPAHAALLRALAAGLQPNRNDDREQRDRRLAERAGVLERVDSTFPAYGREFRALVEAGADAARAAAALGSGWSGILDPEPRPRPDR